MPKKNWKTLIKQKNVEDPTASIEEISSKNQKTAKDIREFARNIPDSRLNDLLNQREVLEARMQGLISGERTRGSSSDPRFPVQTFVQRMNEQKQWEELRAKTDKIRSTFENTDQVKNILPSGVTDGFGRSALSNGISRSFKNSKISSSLETANDALAFRDIQRILRKEPKIVKSAKKAIGGAREAVDSYSNKLKDLDKTLQQQDVSAGDRKEIQETLKSREVEKISSGLNKASSLLSAPRRAADKLEQSRLDRRNKLTGAMDKFDRYAELQKKKLSLDKGGSGDLFQRSEDARKSALKKLLERRMQEKMDQKRRDRAIQKKREKNKAGNLSKRGAKK